jgi:transposase
LRHGSVAFIKKSTAMAHSRMPDEVFDSSANHLPPEQPVGHKDGRPRVGHLNVVRVIWFVLTTGARWEDVPPELGCSGRTAHCRLRAWEESGVWGRLHADLLRRLRKAGKLYPDTLIIDGVTVRAFGGGSVAGGESPVRVMEAETRDRSRTSRRVSMAPRLFTPEIKRSPSVERHAHSWRARFGLTLTTKACRRPQRFSQIT